GAHAPHPFLRLDGARPRLRSHLRPRRRERSLMPTPGARRTRLVLAATSAVLSLAAMVLVLALRTSSGQQFRDQTYQNCESIESVKTAFRLFVRDILKPPPGTTLTPTQMATIRRIETISNRRFQPKGCVKP